MNLRKFTLLRIDIDKTRQDIDIDMTRQKL